MNRILVILALVGFGCSMTDACKKLWAEHNGSCYYVTNDKVLWNDALEECIRLGGHLVTITSKEENDFVKSLAKSRGETVWLGGMNVGDDKSTWRWSSTLERLSFTNWGPKQPNAKDENCLAMHELTWHDYHCESNKLYSICEIDKREVKEVPIILKAIFDKNQ